MRTIGMLMCEPLFLKEYHSKREEFFASGKMLDNLDLSYGNNIYEKIGNTGHINIKGPLSNNGPDMFDIAYGFGGTAYTDIIDAINKAESDNVKEVVFHFDTPGGEVGIVDQVWNKIRGIKTQTISQADGMVASAGYYCASATNRIISGSPSFEIGSIGVIISTYGIKDYLAKDGIKVITLRSSNASRKAPDIETEDGQEEYKERIDATERLFIKRVSTGRGISESHVIKNFGNGAVFQSQDVNKEKPSALKIGMIDEVKQGFRHNVGNVKKGENMSVDVKKENDETRTKETPIVAKEEKITDPGKIETTAIFTGTKKDNSFALGIIKSGTYGQSIISLAAEVLDGSVHESALKAACAAVDAITMKEKTIVTKQEEVQVPVESKVPSEKAYDGVVRTNEDYVKMVNEMKRGAC
jgi:ClpP class serine protease